MIRKCLRCRGTGIIVVPVGVVYSRTRHCVDCGGIGERDYMALFETDIEGNEHLLGQKNLAGGLPKD